MKINRHGEVYIGAVLIGRVEAYEGTKTGFRSGRCCGQVPCKAWRAFDSKGVKVESPKDWASGIERGFRTRKDAVDALLLAAAKKGGK